jgi:hypothetical protein
MKLSKRARKAKYSSAASCKCYRMVVCVCSKGVCSEGRAFEDGQALIDANKKGMFATSLKTNRSFFSSCQ